MGNTDAPITANLTDILPVVSKPGGQADVQCADTEASVDLVSTCPSVSGIAAVAVVQDISPAEGSRHLMPFSNESRKDERNDALPEQNMLDLRPQSPVRAE